MLSPDAERTAVAVALADQALAELRTLNRRLRAMNAKLATITERDESDESD